MRRWLFLTILVITAMVFVFAGMFFLIPRHKNLDARSMADTFIDSLLAGDSDTTYSMLATKTKESEPEDIWKQKVTQLSNFFQDKTVSYQNQETNDTTSVSYVIEGWDGMYRLIVVITKEPEGFKVLMFNSELIRS